MSPHRRSAETSEQALEASRVRATRDVHGSQQLERGRLERPAGKRRSRVLGVVVGVLVAGAMWLVVSLIGLGVSVIGGSIGGSSSGSGTPGTATYWTKTPRLSDGGRMTDCYQQTDENGIAGGRCYTSASAVPAPAWWTAQQRQRQARPDRKAEDSGPTAASILSTGPGDVTGFKLALSLVAGLVTGLVVAPLGGRKTDAANLMRDVSDINQHAGDQHIAVPDELLERFEPFPDAGAHTRIKANALISHVMVDHKGLGTVELARRAGGDILDADGDVEVLAGEILTDDDGDPLTDEVPVVDEAFGEDLFESSGLPVKDEDGTRLRRRFDVRKVPYNPDDANRDRLKGYATIGDLVRREWHLPLYEPQRPAGLYLVDTAPVNVMVLAITRAGKGQTYIEPMIDMWSREDEPSNMVVNDPKGELLVKFFVPLVVRGFEPVQFNLINAMKTDIFNPLGLPIEAAREGDQTKCAQYVENIATVFFPADAGDDPMWNNAASNAFKRAVYGMIDFYLEEEAGLRDYAERTDMDPEVLEQRLDVMWGHVTLYNAYQFFTRLSARKRKSPMTQIKEKEKRRADAVKAGRQPEDAEVSAEEKERAEAMEPLWDGKPEADMLALYFAATEKLPPTMMRTLAGNANNALKAMGGAEKMLGSVYGIAITQMSFFTDPTISTLTSGRPSQNVDLGGASFPRRLGVRFNPDFVKTHHLAGAAASWRAYGDPGFTRDLGPDFAHSDVVSREGWARYYFKGIFPDDEAWIVLELSNAQTGMLMRTFRFHFTKGYRLNLSGRRYTSEPVTGNRIVKDGVLREMVPERDEKGEPTGRYVHGSVTHRVPRLEIDPDGGQPQRINGSMRAVSQMSVRYSEKPKAVFLVTPPHLASYAQIILILIKQLVDLNFDKSYMTKSSQKPLYGTRFMLDELGNLQSGGHGIANFETMLSIGLGQSQSFTLILQTLQQLRDVYGDDVDKIIQGNTADIVFLKSTDDSMIETLEKMSGKTHRTYRDSKTVTRNTDQILGGGVDAKVSYTMSTVEEPVITSNEMAFIAERNSMVFRAGDPPVWNRNETILPMNWRLAQNGITEPGRTYSLQTIPTMSSALDFDVRANQPDFFSMVEKRIQQGVHAADAEDAYKEAYDYTDAQIARLDPEVYSEEVMAVVGMLCNVENHRDLHDAAVDEEDLARLPGDEEEDAYIDDIEAEEAQRQAEERSKELSAKRYAGGQLSRGDLVQPDGTARIKAFDTPMIAAYWHAMGDMRRDRAHFRVDGDDTLRSADGSQIYISVGHSTEYSAMAARFEAASGEARSRVFGDSEHPTADMERIGRFEVHAEFYRYLASLDSWKDLADGRWERAMAVEMDRS